MDEGLDLLHNYSYFKDNIFVLPLHTTSIAIFKICLVDAQVAIFQ